MISNTLRKIIHFFFPLKHYSGEERDYISDDFKFVSSTNENPKLLEDLDEKPTIRWISNHAFSPTEVVLSLERINDDYHLIFREVFKQPDKIRPLPEQIPKGFYVPEEREGRKKVSEELALALINIYSLVFDDSAIQKEKYQNDIMFGPDGFFSFFF